MTNNEKTKKQFARLAPSLGIAGVATKVRRNRKIILPPDAEWGSLRLDNFFPFDP
jgi:hypothetical protein